MTPEETRLHTLVLKQYDDMETWGFIQVMRAQAKTSSTRACQILPRMYWLPKVLKPWW